MAKTTHGWLASIVVALSVVVVSVTTIAAGPASGTSTAPAASDPAQEPSATGCTNPKNPTSTLTDIVPETGLDKGAAQVIGTLLKFTQDGADISERIPPQGWRPAEATGSELAYYGIPARPDPSNKPATAAWLDEWDTHFTSVIPALPCDPIPNAFAQINSPNWSGSVAEAGGYTEAYGETTFNPGIACGVGDSYTNWVGLGGTGSGGQLMQNGFWSQHDNGISIPFDEMLSNTYRNPINPVYTSPPPAHGDVTNISTTYDLLLGKVTFSWHDLTNGKLFQQTWATDPNGVPASNFYDGSTAEAIDERGEFGTTISTLRNYGTDPWSQVQVARNGGALSPIRDESPHDGFFMWNLSSTAEISVPSSGPTATQFTDTWIACA